MKDKEVWKPIEKYKGFYEISCLGRVRSLDRQVSKINKSSKGKIFNQIQKVKGRLLVKTVNRCGYERIRTQVNSKRVQFSIHREVAKAFIPNPTNKPCVNHKDGNKVNNSLSNLEWCTYSENSIHAIEKGLIARETGLGSGRLAYEIKVLDLEGNYLYSTYGHKELKDKGFDPKLVHKVTSEGRLTHKGHKFIKVKYNK
jgi:hypothetical protein